MVGGGLLAASLGCQEDPAVLPAVPEATPSSSTVPLRLWMTGNETQAETIRRGWESLSSQPLAIEVIPWTRLPDDDFLAGWSRKEERERISKSCDLMLAPHALLADLVQAKAIVPLAGEALVEIIQDVFPSLRSGLGNHAGQNYCLPISSALPTLLSAEPIDLIETWEQYDAIVQDWNGAAAEPTAAGWAGMMFLWRAAGRTQRWLFDPNSFESVVGDDDYVQALQQMKTTCDRYSHKEATPTEIESLVSAGKLRGGIGYPGTLSDPSSSTINLSDLPRGGGVGGEVSAGTGVLLDLMSPVIALSSNCRQSMASKTFIRWISGGEGSETTRDQLPGVFPVSATSDSRNQGGSLYRNHLSERFSQPITVPNLTILRGHEYYSKLDQQVRACLAGDQKASEALGELKDQWNALTQEIGAEKQARAWRQSKGMRA